MPYTPPAHSPGASPSTSRSSSFSSPDAPPRPPAVNPHGPQNPPRSSSYLNRPRRSSSGTLPAFSATPDYTAYNAAGPSRPRSNTAPAPLADPRLGCGSVHQSPPPVDSRLSVMPPGAFMSPPDSTQNSSDEEDSDVRRGRDLGRLEDELKEAIKKLPQQRFPSPEHGDPVTVQLVSRRASHQRTRSEPMLIDIAVRPRSGSHSGSISDLDDDDACCRMAPAMVRKKSGEVVKSSLKSPGRSRPCSVPSTPTFPPKNVHFDSQIEKVRHFLHSEKPSAVSVGSSPVEGVYDAESEYPFGEDDMPPQWEIALPNFHKDHPHLLARKSLPVRLEKVCLSSDKKTLIGTVAVVNIAFQKHVAARFTFDYWQTVSEVSAEWSSDVRRRERNDGVDRFVFKIKLAEQTHLEKKTLFFCVKYSSGGQEHWDNNGGVNFQVDFKKSWRHDSSSSSLALPRSRPASASTRPRSVPDFGAYLDDNFSSVQDMVRQRPKPASKVAAPVEEDTAVLARRANPTGSAFGSRYDFRHSYNATVKQQPKATDPKSSSMSPSASAPSALLAPPLSSSSSSSSSTSSSSADGSYFALPAHKSQLLASELSSTTPPISPSISGAGPPEVFSTENFWTHEGKPSIQSPSYLELLNNYCFFGSSKSAPKATNTPAKAEPKKESQETKIKESLQILLPSSPMDRAASPQFAAGALNGAAISPPSLSVAQQKSSGNASPIPLNYAGYHHRRRGSGAFRFEAVQPTPAIC